MSAAGTYRYHLPLDGRDAELTTARLWAGGALGVWERPDELIAWFASPQETGLPSGGSWAYEPDRDWQAAWKATVGPVWAPPFVVVPSWSEAEHCPGDDEVTLVLDPGRAFGSGHHATTALCLEALGREELTGRRVLDVGCGSGILAIAAARRGARVLAVDLDPDAVAVTHENAARNGVSVTARVGSVPLATQRADVVVANLITEVIVDLALALVAATAPGGALIVSGIGAERQAEAASALGNAGLEPAEHHERDGWSLLVARRTGMPPPPMDHPTSEVGSTRRPAGSRGA